MGENQLLYLASMWWQYSLTLYIQVFNIILASNAKDYYINKYYNDFKTQKLIELYECERELFIVPLNERYREKEYRDTVIICLCLSKLSKKKHIIECIYGTDDVAYLVCLCYIHTRGMN